MLPTKNHLLLTKISIFRWGHAITPASENNHLTCCNIVEGVLSHHKTRVLFTFQRLGDDFNAASANSCYLRQHCMHVQCARHSVSQSEAEKEEFIETHSPRRWARVTLIWQQELISSSKKQSLILAHVLTDSHTIHLDGEEHVVPAIMIIVAESLRHRVWWKSMTSFMARTKTICKW